MAEATKENRLARELNTRDHEKRKAVWQPPEVLPDPMPHPGWVFRWIRTSLLGTPDPMNVSAKTREGWVPVRAEDHPELALHADESSKFKGCIEVGGLLLCKAPEEMAKQRDEFYAKQAQAQMEAVDNNFMKVNDNRMPLFNQRRTETTFGRGSK